jgi:hypothetical protein
LVFLNAAARDLMLAGCLEVPHILGQHVRYFSIGSFGSYNCQSRLGDWVDRRRLMAVHLLYGAALLDLILGVLIITLPIGSRHRWSCM